MADPAYRLDQWSRRYDNHVAPLNQLVDDHAGLSHGWLPYIAPMYGGVNARLLSLLRDPGPKTRVSGLLSMENDDPSAEATCGYFADVGISADDIVPVNISRMRSGKLRMCCSQITSLPHLIGMARSRTRR